MDALSFNDLSLIDSDEMDIEKFFNCWRGLKNILLLPRTPNVRFDYQQLTAKNKQGKAFHQLINDSNLDQLQKAALHNELAKSIFSMNDQPDKITINGDESYGFTDSHHNEFAVISIPSRDFWCDFEVIGKNQELDENGDIKQTDISFKNVGSLDGYAASWLSELIPNQYASADIFILYLENSFTNIELAIDLKDYLKKNPIKSNFRKLEDAIHILSDYAKNNWKKENVNWTHIKGLGLNVRPESEQTINRYGYQRNFKNELNENEQFSFHFDMPKFYRAYLKPLNQSKSFFIAYIGPHLDIVSG